MRILCDKAMPNAREVLSPYGEITFKPGREIVPEDLKGIDALMIRSVTRVNADLLKHASQLKFIGTATAGFDHVDTGLLETRGIAFSAAPGNNADSVGDYVLSALLVLGERYALNLKELSLGIIGCGHTGSAVYHRLRNLFKEVKRRDPPLARQGVKGVDVSLEECLNCDVLTLHVPLNRDGADRTLHLLGEDELRVLASHGGILVNASRGPVVDNQALARVLKAYAAKGFKAWLDVFEGEPQIAVREVLPMLEGATAHIAGYSLDSKFRATHMIAESMASALKLAHPAPFKAPPCEIEEMVLHEVADVDADLLRRLVFAVYDVRRDSHLFRQRCVDGTSFDLLRSTYRERRELSTVTLRGIGGTWQAILSEMGFKCV